MRKILLILLFVFTLFAEESEEIGVPYMEEGQGEVKSATLDPNGEYFYTLKDEIITKWQLEPVKPINSFKIKLPRGLYRMSISSDSNKMVLWRSNLLSLVDLKTQKQVKTIDEEITSNSGVMDGLVFKAAHYRRTIENDRVGREYVYKEYSLDNLEIINKALFPHLCNDSALGCTYKHMFIYKNMIFASTGEMEPTGVMAILDKKTLKELDENRRIISSSCYFTLDKKSLYCITTQFEYIKVNLDTLEEESVHSNSLEKQSTMFVTNKKLVDKKIVFSVIHSNFSVFKNISLVVYRDRGAKFTSLNFYNNETSKELGTLHQFENEWVLITPEGYFGASDNAKKHLKMKIKSGKVVPINSATFNKYNKKINLKG